MFKTYFRSPICQYAFICIVPNHFIRINWVINFVMHGVSHIVWYRSNYCKNGWPQITEKFIQDIDIYTSLEFTHVWKCFTLTKAIVFKQQYCKEFRAPLLFNRDWAHVERYDRQKYRYLQYRSMCNVFISSYSFTFKDEYIFSHIFHAPMDLPEYGLNPWKH